MTGVAVRPAGPADWPEVCTVMGVRGDPSWCWCQYHVTTGESYRSAPQGNRAALQRQVTGSGVPIGLLARRDGEPVGWLRLGPAPSFPRITGNRARRRALTDGGVEDPAGLWCVTCFVVRVGHRRRGVAAALLDAAAPFARAHGAAVLEGHPVDTAGGRTTSATLYHGALSTFARAGYQEVARTAPHRPVVRLPLP